MKTGFIPAAAAVIVVLAPALAPVWSADGSDTTATIKDDARTAGHAVAHSASTTGHAIAGKSREVGHAIADDTRSARDTIRDDSKKAGHAFADGARKFGRSVREAFHMLKGGITGKPSEPAPKN